MHNHSECNNSSINCGNTNSYGCIPCSLKNTQTSNLAFKNQYIYDMAVPMNAVPVYKGNQLQFLILFYKSGSSFSSGGRISLRYTRRISYPFHFEEEKNLGDCLLSSSGYFPCGASSEGIGCIQPPCTQFWVNQGFYDNVYNCNPLAILCYLNATTINCPNPNYDPPLSPINHQTEGIIPSRLNFTNTNWALDIQDLRITKIGENKIRLYWTQSGGQYCNSYRITQGSFTADSFKKQGKFCSLYENVIYDHFRKYRLIQNNYYDMPIPQGNSYFLVQPVCNEITMIGKNGEPFNCYYIDTKDTEPPTTVLPFTLNYISEGSTGFNSLSIERLVPICECTDGGGSCGRYFPQPGDQGR